MECHIYMGRNNIIQFTELEHMVINKFSGWQNNLISIGGKTLIKLTYSVITNSTYFVSLETPKTILYQIEDFFSYLFLGQLGWCSWKNICYPIEEGSLGFKICLIFAKF